jgi:hypothetical protein
MATTSFLPIVRGGQRLMELKNVKGKVGMHVHQSRFEIGFLPAGCIPDIHQASLRDATIRIDLDHYSESIMYPFAGKYNRPSRMFQGLPGTAHAPWHPFVICSQRYPCSL